MKKMQYQFDMTVYNVNQKETPTEVIDFQAQNYVKREKGLLPMLSENFRKSLEQAAVDRFAKCAISPVRLRLTIEQNDPRTANFLDKIYYKVCSFFRGR